MKLIRWAGAGVGAGARLAGRGETGGDNDPGARTSDAAALLFGGGLIGGAVQRALAGRGAAAVRDMPWSWHDAGARQGESSAMAEALAAVPPADLAVIWAAGRSGFGSTEAEMAAEGDLVDEILALTERLAAALPGPRVTLHLISSAGGLFEGQTACGPAARPQQLRPYGFGKLAQEAALARLDPAIRRRIYRPSSVYGFAPGARMGLVPVLMANALRGRVTRISGGLSTLRDYVLLDDLGRFIAARIRDPGPSPAETCLLAQGRPATIHEVLRLAGKAIAMPLHLQFDARPANARHIGFLPSALPRDWQPTALPVGIAQTAAQVRRNFVDRAA